MPPTPPRRVRVGEPDPHGRHRRPGAGQPVSRQSLTRLTAEQHQVMRVRVERSRVSRNEWLRRAVHLLREEPASAGEVAAVRGPGVVLGPKVAWIPGPGDLVWLGDEAMRLGVDMGTILRVGVGRLPDPPAERWTAARCAQEWGIKRRTWDSYWQRSPALAPPPVGVNESGFRVWDPEVVRGFQRPGRGHRSDIDTGE